MDADEEGRFGPVKFSEYDKNSMLNTRLYSERALVYFGLKQTVSAVS